MKYIQEITLDLNSNNAFPVVNAKQGDVESRFILVHYTKDGEKYEVSSDNSVALRVRKPDKHLIFDDCTIQNGDVIVPLKYQCLTTAGRAYADLVEFNSDGQMLSTQSFIINIQASPDVMGQEALSSDDFLYLKSFIDRGNQVIGSAQAQAEEAAESENNAKEWATRAETQATRAETQATRAENIVNNMTDYILIQDSQPTSEVNKIWIDPSDPIEISTPDDFDSEIDNLKNMIKKIDFSNATNVKVSGEDLNNYTEGGVWYFPSSVSPLNKPTGTASFGLLMIICGGNAGRLLQIWINNASTTNSVYTRTKSAVNGDWSSWKRLATDVDIEEINTIINEGFESTYSGLGMFNRIGIIGDSFASGGIHTEDGISVLYENSWPQVIGRKLGIAVNNYTVSGYTTRAFVNPDSSDYNTRGLGAILADITSQKKCGLYIFAMGINDASISNYLGDIDDINLSNPSQNANTFYGNTGKIISAIRTNAPDSKIVLQTFTRPANATGTATYNNYNEAIIAIANLFSLPYVDIRTDPYFESDYYNINLAVDNTQHYRHPTLDMYVGYAEAIMRLYAKCIMKNPSYFYNYKNTDIYNDKYYQAGQVIKFANTYVHFVGVAQNTAQLRVFIPLNKPVKATSFIVSGGFYLKSSAYDEVKYGLVVDDSPSNYDAVFGNASIVENGIAFSLSFVTGTLTARELYGIGTSASSSVSPLIITFT